MKAYISRPALLLAWLIAVPGPAQADLTERAEVRAFITDMVTRHHFEENMLRHLFAQVSVRDSIIKAITRPAEAKPWYEYRQIFVRPARIRGGVDFWNKHAADLERAEQVYGVPPEVVTAIIGVETRYGRQTGGYRVMDALATLGFDYPPRGDFFRRELEHYLLLTREEGIDPMSLKGSYAGAMGMGQFIASSFRAYAVDFDDDGKRDLWHSVSDAIGSVAHYLSRHGWVRGGPVATRANASGKAAAALVAQGIEPRRPLAEFTARGIKPQADWPDTELAALIELEQKDGPEYWLAANNFYVITRYNHSQLYAMAVYQLAQAIRREQRAGVASRAP
ncbi:MAG TPA: lytic murein transglycosylase B [Gammaproteobacteria bacterium]|nr:lytic murein transglycosylase B [Gammaproteobacteria bacterium]